MNAHCLLFPAGTRPRAAAPSASDAPEKRTIYVLIRGDIPLAQQLVQAAHAAAEAGRHHYRSPAEHGIASLIVLSVPDRAALMAAQTRLTAKGIASTLFFEPDFGIGESALGTEPLLDTQRKHLMGWPLWREATPTAPGLAASPSPERQAVLA